MDRLQQTFEFLGFYGQLSAITSFLIAVMCLLVKKWRTKLRLSRALEKEITDKLLEPTPDMIERLKSTRLDEDVYPVEHRSDSLL